MQAIVVSVVSGQLHGLVRHAHSEEVAGLVLVHDQLPSRGGPPALGHMRRQGPPLRILHDQAQVVIRQDELVHIDEVDVPGAKFCLHLRIVYGRSRCHLSWEALISCTI